MIMPGDDGQLLFTGDGYPLKSGGDRTAGAWSAGALDVLYDPYYGVAGANASLLAGALDTAARLRGYGTSFFELSQAQQVEIVDYLSGHEVVGEVLRHAARIVMTATLGAAKSDSVTQLIGWPGPNGGYYSAARHPLILWRQPSSMTQDGNLA
jgi:hypothetical protein